MSEPVLERSVLERKERDELQTIARAMGASPPSRARKADLVDLILASAGIAPSTGEGGADAAADAPDTGGDDQPAPRPRRRTRSRGGADTEAADEAQADGTDDAGPPASLFDEGSGRSGRAGEGDDGGGGRDRGRGRRRGGGDDRSGREGDDGTEATAGRAGDDRGRKGDDESRGDQAERGERDRGGDGGRGDTAENGQHDEGEGGNRRRRRRGRDRDRGGASDDSFNGEPVEVAGLLDLRDEGYGFLRTRGYLPSKDDVYVSVKQVRQFSLRKGDHVTGASRPATRNEKNPALLRIDQVNGREPDAARDRPRFEELTPVSPVERLRLTGPDDPSNTTARIVDLVTPVGRGQRGLVVSPPNAGRTTLLQDLSRALGAHEPDVTVFVVLVDERPEDATEVRRSASGEVVASPFDRPAEEHTSVAELVLERAKRLAEDGGDVVLLVDGITRLARAYNLTVPGTGRVGAGGVDAAALHPAKRFFGAARNLEEGGSITMLATVLAGTGSKLDEVVVEELRGAGNLELRLDRRLADAGLFPAVDVVASSTRHAERLLDADELERVQGLRRSLSDADADADTDADGGPAVGALERLLAGVRSHATNAELLAEAPGA